MSLPLKETYLKYKVCVICNVPQSQAPGVLYAKFPQNVNRCRRWIRVIGDVNLLQLSLKRLQYRFVCGNHFLPHYFTKSGKHLTKDAVPTVFPHTIKPLKRDVVKLFPMLMNRTKDKILLKCTQRIVPIIDPALQSPDSPTYEYLDEFREHMDPDAPEVSEPLITIKQESLDPTLQECLPKIIPILHHNLAPNSYTTEVYTINKDREVIPITTKVLNDGKECIIELSRKKIPVVPKEPKVIPVSDKVLSRILKKDYVDVEIEPIYYNSRKKSKTKLQREEKLQHQIVKLQRRNKQLKRILKNICLVDEIVSPNIKRVIEKAIYNKQLKEGINEFTHEKKMAAAILKRALSAYHYLSCLMPLPSVCALEKIAKGIPSRSKTTKCRHLL
ncbi:uncharacterized protein LOC134756080 isoform X1 [Cydia strobilella]|uniref:uncharacterized protein LOC134756080 isoform X1 n=1 Tax=Cydia strobilella TaxID=1100964 RepID=UPI00300412B7